MMESHYKFLFHKIRAGSFIDGDALFEVNTVFFPAVGSECLSQEDLAGKSSKIYYVGWRNEIRHLVQYPSERR